MYKPLARRQPKKEIPHGQILQITLDMIIGIG